MVSVWHSSPVGRGASVAGNSSTLDTSGQPLTEWCQAVCTGWPIGFRCRQAVGIVMLGCVRLWHSCWKVINTSVRRQKKLKLFRVEMTLLLSKSGQHSVSLGTGSFRCVSSSPPGSIDLARERVPRNRRSSGRSPSWVEFPRP